MLRLRVASQAAPVVFFRGLLKPHVRRVAGQAREPAQAFAKAAALAEVQWLVTRVPSVVPIGVVAGGWRLAVATAAEFVERRCSQRLWISDRPLLAPQPDMFLARPMA
jgi:hypothetical protein